MRSLNASIHSLVLEAERSGPSDRSSSARPRRDRSPTQSQARPPRSEPLWHGGRRPSGPCLSGLSGPCQVRGMLKNAAKQRQTTTNVGAGQSGYRGCDQGLRERPTRSYKALLTEPMVWSDVEIIRHPGLGSVSGAVQIRGKSVAELLLLVMARQSHQHPINSLHMRSHESPRRPSVGHSAGQGVMPRACICSPDA